MTKALQLVSNKTGAIAVNGKFAITPVGLRVLTNPSFEDWCEFGHGLQKLECATQWTVGDWLNYGERRWGEKYAQAIEETPLNHGTLRDYAWVASQIDLSVRTDKLSWWHHRLIATDDYTPEQRQELLATAERDGLSVVRFKKYLLEQKRLAQIVENSPREGDNYRLIHADIADGMAQIETGSIDVIITDPPYPKEYLPLYETMASEARRVLKSGALLIAMCGQSYLPEIYAMLGKHLAYWWTGAYLTAGPSTQLWERRIFTQWKPLLIFCNGEYGGNYLFDVCKSDAPDKESHDWGQSVSGMLDVVKRFSIEGDLILDPFTGASATGASCLPLKRRFIGIDNDLAQIDMSATRLSHIMPKVGQNDEGN